MESRAPESIPYYVHEGMMARQERTIRRLLILCIIIFLAFVGSNLGWMYYESQFTEEVTTTYTSDATDGGNAVINGNGSVNINGESD
jgi:hypothetical protein